MSYRRTVGMVATVVAAIVVVSALHAGQGRGKTPPPRDVTLTGKIVDLQSFMTGKFASSDHRKCTRECIRAGVPIALETDEGIVIIGEGVKGPQRTITPFALQVVELKGKLYERHGLRYIDITSAKEAKRPPEPDEEEPWTPEPDEPDEDDPSPDGACCLSGGVCVDTNQEDCEERGGKFYGWLDCESVECGPERP